MHANLALSVTQLSCMVTCLVDGSGFPLQSWHWLTSVVHEVFFYSIFAISGVLYFKWVYGA